MLPPALGTTSRKASRLEAAQIVPLLPSAFTVAFLAAVESLLSPVADSMSGDRHKPNVELCARSVANIASPLFGGEDVVVPSSSQTSAELARIKQAMSKHTTSS